MISSVLQSRPLPLRDKIIPGSGERNPSLRVLIYRKEISRMVQAIVHLMAVIWGGHR